MPHSEDKTLNNWLIQVVAPVLIMLMVGSLVFFFVEILYRGPHTARLCWVLGLFTLASVLVSRVSIKEGSERAALFGLALAGATFVTSMVIVDFDYGGFSLVEPLVLLVLIGTVMWAAGKLTWDCTVVDSSRDVSASGLLVVVRRRFFKIGIVSDHVEPPESFSKSERQPVSEQSNSQLGRGMFSRLFTPGKLQNTPGLWVFYFSLFALPVFGVGQWFVSSARQSGYGWVFVLFSIYLGSGLSLLMVTSLLGLDRYVSRRNLDIPLSIARSWLTIGALVAGITMLIVLLIPRPDASAGASDALAWFTSRTKRSAGVALGKDGQERKQNGANSATSENGKKQQGSEVQVPGEGASGPRQMGKADGKRPSQASAKGSTQEGKASSSQGQKGKTVPSQSMQHNSRSKRVAGNTNQENPRSPAKQATQKSSPVPRSSTKRRNAAGQPKSEERRSDRKSGQRGDSTNPKSIEDSGSTEPSNQSRNRPQGPPGNPAKKKRSSDAKEKTLMETQSSSNSEAHAQQNKSKNQTVSSSTNVSPAMPARLARGLSGLLKGLIYLIGFVAMLILIWMFRKEIAEFWAQLGWSREKPVRLAVAIQDRELDKPRFSDFSDPFQSGQYRKLSAAQLVQYTHAALEAWARSHGCEQGADKTPHELAARIHEIDPRVGREAIQLADVYCRLEFSQQVVARQELNPLKKLWRTMVSQH